MGALIQFSATNGFVGKVVVIVIVQMLNTLKLRGYAVIAHKKERCEECENYELEVISTWVKINNCKIANNSYVVRPLSNKKDCPLLKEESRAY